MRQSRTESRKQEREQRRRKRNKLLIMNLLLLTIIGGLVIGGVWTGALDLNSLFNKEEVSKQEEPAKSKPPAAAVKPSKPADPDQTLEEQNRQPDPPKLETGNAETSQDRQDKDKDNKGMMDETDKEQVIHFTFVGDVMNAGRVATVVEEQGYDYPYEHVRERFNRDDVTIANLETPLTTGGVPVTDMPFVYKSNPKMAKAMKKAGIDVVNVANNHILDQGEEGMFDTFAALNEAEISYMGAGKNSTDAYSPAIMEKKGVKIAIFGFSRFIPKTSWVAGSKPGVAATYDSTRAVQEITKVRDKVDLIIVVPHWGVEKEDQPVEHQKQLAKAYIDAGADLIVGGHPHVLQGIESYKDKWIIYSMGNFIFTRATEPKTWETMMLEAEYSIPNKSFKLQMKPYYTELGQAVPLTGEKGQKLIQRLESISFQVRIDKDGFISRK